MHCTIVPFLLEAFMDCLKYHMMLLASLLQAAVKCKRNNFYAVASESSEGGTGCQLIVRVLFVLKMFYLSCNFIHEEPMQT